MTTTRTDTPVTPEAAALLDRWVQLQGSATLTDAERTRLATEVAARGEQAPTLYRGVNMETTPTFRAGQTIRLGAVSTSEEEGSALPYAENGPGLPVLFEIDGARGVNVTERAEAVAGFAEQEWITAGRFRVEQVERYEDELLVNLRWIGA